MDFNEWIKQTDNEDEIEDRQTARLGWAVLIVLIIIIITLFN